VSSIELFLIGALGGVLYEFVQMTAFLRFRDLNVTAARLLPFLAFVVVLCSFAGGITVLILGGIDGSTVPIAIYIGFASAAMTAGLAQVSAGPALDAMPSSAKYAPTSRSDRRSFPVGEKSQKTRILREVWGRTDPVNAVIGLAALLLAILTFIVK
jgi:hypothetical protein